MWVLHLLINNFSFSFLIIHIGKDEKTLKKEGMQGSTMGEVLIVEHGLSMRKLYPIIFKGKKLIFANTPEEIIKIYREREPSLALILSNDPNDVDIVNLIKILSKKTKIIWIGSNDKFEEIKDRVDASFSPPFGFDDFILKYQELIKV